MDKKVKHMEMVQGIINRMAGNSFMLKGWAVTLVAAVFALAGNDMDKMYFLVAYCPIIVFWGLDSYYLFQERLYRSLYNRIRLMKEENVDFNMDVKLMQLQSGDSKYWECLISLTEIGFYLPLALLTAGIIIITHI